MLRISAVVLAVGMISSTAYADGKPADAQKPWSVGVTAERKAEAQQHLDAGNKLYLGQDYKAALEEYRLAVAAWDHPAIRYNMVRCLIWLERWMDASDNLKLALAYGADPYDQDIYGEVLMSEKLLASQ